MVQQELLLCSWQNTAPCIPSLSHLLVPLFYQFLFTFYVWGFKPDIDKWLNRSADGHCLQEVLERLTSGNVIQRRNAIDVISELIRISSQTDSSNSHLAWYKASLRLLPLCHFSIL